MPKKENRPIFLGLLRNPWVTKYRNYIFMKKIVLIKYRLKTDIIFITNMHTLIPNSYFDEKKKKSNAVMRHF